MTGQVQQNTIETKVMDVLETIAGTEQVRRDPDIELFHAHILDSLALVELMITLAEVFDIQISPAEIDREQWSTPRKIVAYINQKLGES